MAIDILNTTTLSEALTASTAKFTVGSTANMTAGTSALAVVGTAGLEMMFVQSIPVSGEITVLRGWNGTKAVPHASGTRVFIGAPSAFIPVSESGPRDIGLAGNAGNFPQFALPGTHATDGNGNVYVLCELTAVTYSGTTVRISTDGTWTATVLSGGDKGPVGLTVDGGTSDQYVWVQRYGYNAYAQDSVADSAGTSALLAIAATTNSAPDVGLAAVAATSFSSVVGAGQYVIHGMYISGAPTTATTSATSSTGVAYPVFLNWPFVNSFLERTAVTS